MKNLYNIQAKKIEVHNLRPNFHKDKKCISCIHKIENQDDTISCSKENALVSCSDNNWPNNFEYDSISSCDSHVKEEHYQVTNPKLIKRIILINVAYINYKIKFIRKLFNNSFPPNQKYRTLMRHAKNMEHDLNDLIKEYSNKNISLTKEEYSDNEIKVLNKFIQELIKI